MSTCDKECTHQRTRWDMQTAALSPLNETDIGEVKVRGRAMITARAMDLIKTRQVWPRGEDLDK